METKELEQLIYKNYDWDKVNYEISTLYTPPIKYGKVIKVYEGDTILIATKLPYIDDTKKNSLIYSIIYKIIFKYKNQIFFIFLNFN